MSLGKNIKIIRKKWRLNRDEFGELLDSTGPRVSQYEIDNNEPKIVFIIRLQQLTNINTYDLYYSDLNQSDIPTEPLVDNLAKPKPKPTGTGPTTDKYYLMIKLAEMDKQIIELQRQMNQLADNQ